MTKAPKVAGKCFLILHHKPSICVASEDSKLNAVDDLIGVMDAEVVQLSNQYLGRRSNLLWSGLSD